MTPAGTMNSAQPSRPVIATERRASLVLPVFFNSQSVASPPTVSPMTPANSGSEAKMPTLSKREVAEVHQIGRQPTQEDPEAIHVGEIRAP